MRSCDVPMRFIVVSEDYSFDDDQAEPLIKVEIAYATPELQLIVPLNAPVGATAFEAVRQSNITFEFSEINIDKTLRAPSRSRWMGKAARLDRAKVSKPVKKGK